MENYKILGVNPNDDLGQIKKAYHMLIMVHHPDKGGKVADFIKIQTAWEWMKKYHNQLKPNVINITFSATDYGTITYY